MVRYVGDLTDLANRKERERAAEAADAIAEAIRDRKVRTFSLHYRRDVIPQTRMFGVTPAMTPWTVGVEVDKRGRHER